MRISVGVGGERLSADPNGAAMIQRVLRVCAKVHFTGCCLSSWRRRLAAVCRRTRGKGAVLVRVNSDGHQISIMRMQSHDSDLRSSALRARCACLHRDCNFYIYLLLQPHISGRWRALTINADARLNDTERLQSLSLGSSIDKHHQNR